MYEYKLYYVHITNVLYHLYNYDKCSQVYRTSTQHLKLCYRKKMYNLMMKKIKI